MQASNDDGGTSIHAQTLVSPNLASKVRAIAPATIGLDALVPPNALSHSSSGAVVLCEKEGEKERERERERERVRQGE